ncbi:MAG: hypothetical protein FD129_2139, partial [bacterium]
MRQLGQFVIDLLPQPRGQEGESLQQPLDIRIGAAIGQEVRGIRVGIGELLPQFAEVTQFVEIVAMEHEAPP